MGRSQANVPGGRQAFERHGVATISVVVAQREAVLVPERLDHPDPVIVRDHPHVAPVPVRNELGPKGRRRRAHRRYVIAVIPALQRRQVRELVQRVARRSDLRLPGELLLAVLRFQRLPHVPVVSRVVEAAKELFGRHCVGR